MAKTTAAKAASRTLATFRATHDPAVKIPAKIKAALDRLRRDHGDQAYAYEQSNPSDDNVIPPFIKMIDSSSAILSQYRAQFAEHIVKVRQDTGARRGGRLVWFATVKAATDARGGPATPSDIE